MVLPFSVGITDYGCDTLHNGKYTGCTGIVMSVFVKLCTYEYVYKKESGEGGQVDIIMKFMTRCLVAKWP